jgi:hypothetical protein
MNLIEKVRKIAERTVAGLMAALEACADIFKPTECANYSPSLRIRYRLIGVRSLEEGSLFFAFSLSCGYLARPSDGLARQRR